MENKELELRKEVEAVGRLKLRIDWDTDSILIPLAFTEFEGATKGLEKTLEYWEEFLKSDLYEEYWEKWRKKGKYDDDDWEFHLDDVMSCFFVFIREKRKEKKNEQKRIRD